MAVCPCCNATCLLQRNKSCDKASSGSLQRVYDISHESCSEIITQTFISQRSPIYPDCQNLSPIT
ncbi:hypothetical protein I7I53_02480 [Histoplasma capsulatum var. duboisii H88]|uniref:Uncharacterized protein n=1 Tax=Ajellomyces capsulatus (strain H88) TaxID=544711 RepID=A0A8A1LLF1_AJEC8|nr:hypothetical protein I7I53_02480 [Histoplasma capsulatum var. duboisii H88]